MGVVYKARDTRLDRLVALKLLPPRLLDSAEARRHFAGEARAISSLNHSNIATVYEVAEDLKPVRPDLPHGFERIVRRATEKDRRRRYQSMEEFAADLCLLQKNREAAIAVDEALKILVVEDEDDLRRGVEISLSCEGFQVMKAANGRDGVRLAIEEGPDLVLLDVLLPGMNGLDVCRELRRKRFDAPIIMLSARSEEIDRVAGLEAGADDYVTKPFSMRELLARVRVQLRRRRMVQAA